MSPKAHWLPHGYHTVTPYLITKGCSKAIDFYKRAFGATETMRMDGPGGLIMHAEMLINKSPIMLADEFPQMGIVSPQTLGGSAVLMVVYVENVDALAQQAINAGATVEKPLQDQFYGDRSVSLIDPFGHRWTLATHIEDVSPEEMKRRMAAMPKGPS